MPYEPLHHKYRPQRFADLVGQQAIAQTLTSALEQNRIAPAYLFAGPRGTGKTSSARILAKSLNCLAGGGPTAHPCGQCQTCVEITQGRALDVVEIDAASNTGVDNIRELIERAQFAPVQCRYKVYVLDEVHMLSGAAFNALLKTLEEPPVHVVFVLATTDPQRVLPTIISRCQRFDFRRIPLDDMVSHLGMIAQQEAIEIAPEAVTLVAQIAQGGLRDAESLLDQLSLVPTGVTVEAVWDLVGAVPERDLLALVSSLAVGDPEAALDCLRRLMDRGREPMIVLQNLASFYRDLLIAKTAPDRSDLVALTEPTWRQLCEFAQGQDLSWILQGQQHLKSGESLLKNSTQPRLWLEVTLMGLLPGAIAPAAAPVPAMPTMRSAAAAPMVALPAPVPIAPSLIAPSPIAAPPATAGQPLDLAGLLGRSGWDAGAIGQLTQTITTWATSDRATLDGLIAALQTLAGVSAPPQPATPAPIAPPPAIAPIPAPMSVSTGPDATFAPDPVPPAPAPASAELDRLWKEVLEKVQPISTRTMLSQIGRLLVFDGQQVAVSVPPSWVEKIQPRTKAIENAFYQHLQRPVTVTIRAANASFPQSPPAATSPKMPPQAQPPPAPQPRPSPPPTMPTATITAANPMAAGSGGIGTNPIATNPIATNQIATNPIATTHRQQVAPPRAIEPVAAAPSDRPTPNGQNGSRPPRELVGFNPDPASSPTHAPTHMPPQPQNDDQVLRSARSLAQLFNGEVIVSDDIDWI
ncbi:MAG: DNA polymerase III subunit gamma/tau [Oscillatoriales cyanobacterium]|nr:MAG: DNA polymerase III subunit gamma/tau [Oscillatoriales cyanobacterium]